MEAALAEKHPPSTEIGNVSSLRFRIKGDQEEAMEAHPWSRNERKQKRFGEAPFPEPYPGPPQGVLDLTVVETDYSNTDDPLPATCTYK